MRLGQAMNKRSRRCMFLRLINELIVDPHNGIGVFWISFFWTSRKCGAVTLSTRSKCCRFYSTGGGGPLTAALFSRLGPHSFALRVGGVFISTNGGSSGSEHISGRAEAKTGRNEVRIGGTCLLTLIMLRHMVAETMQPTSLQPDRSYPASLR